MQLHLLNILTNLKSSDLTSERKQGLRNYLQSKAVLSDSVHRLSVCLKGLQVLGDVPSLKISEGSVVPMSGGKIHVEIVDNYGKAFNGAKNIQVSLVPIEGGSSKDLTKNT